MLTKRLNDEQLLQMALFVASSLIYEPKHQAKLTADEIIIQYILQKEIDIEEVASLGQKKLTAQILDKYLAMLKDYSWSHLVDLGMAEVDFTEGGVEYRFTDDMDDILDQMLGEEDDENQGK